MGNQGPKKPRPLVRVGRDEHRQNNQGSLSDFNAGMSQNLEALEQERLFTVTPGGNEDELNPLFTQQSGMRFSEDPNARQGQTVTPPPSPHFGTMPLSTPSRNEPGSIDMQTYKQRFGQFGQIGQASDAGNFYAVLAHNLQTRSDEKTFYADKLANMKDFLEYAREGAKHDALANPNDTDKQERFQTVDLLFRKFQSLQALARSNTLYTDAQYQKVWKEVEQLLNNQDVTNETKAALKKSLDSALEDNLYRGRKFYDTRWTGNTGLDTTVSSNKLKEKYRKRVKIEHEGDTVIGTFSYNRECLLGTRPFGGHLKLWGSASSALGDLRNQAKEFVTTAINEYGKGTSPDKPIQLYYTGKEMPEAATQILMEFKMEAIRRGEPFYAKDKNGQIIEITPKPGFSPQEKAYFAEYAMAIPKANKAFSWEDKKANACAGYKLFKNTEGASLTQADRKNEDRIFTAMEKHLEKGQQVYKDAKQKRLDKVETQLTQSQTQRRDIRI